MVCKYSSSRRRNRSQILCMHRLEKSTSQLGFIISKNWSDRSRQGPLITPPKVALRKSSGVPIPRSIFGIPWYSHLYLVRVILPRKIPFYLQPLQGLDMSSLFLVFLHTFDCIQMRTDQTCIGCHDLLMPYRCMTCRSQCYICM